MTSTYNKRVLYFDIDGTILQESSGTPKPALVNGVFEQYIRQAAFDRLVCVGNASAIVHSLDQMNESIDGIGLILALCQGVISDEEWLRHITSLAIDPFHRVCEIDFSVDWWYVDDLAQFYCERDGYHKEFEKNIGSRIFVPRPDGDGTGICRWLQKIGSI